MKLQISNKKIINNRMKKVVNQAFSYLRAQIRHLWIQLETIKLEKTKKDD